MDGLNSNIDGAKELEVRIKGLPKVWKPPDYQVIAENLFSISNKYIRGSTSGDFGYVDYSCSKEILTAMIRDADDATYDTISYLIGFDFEPSDHQIVESVYDLVLMKATKLSRSPYKPTATEEYLHRGLYLCGTDCELPSNIRSRVDKRKLEEQEFLKKE